MGRGLPWARGGWGVLAAELVKSCEAGGRKWGERAWGCDGGRAPRRSQVTPRRPPRLPRSRTPACEEGPARKFAAT